MHFPSSSPQPPEQAASDALAALAAMWSRRGTQAPLFSAAWLRYRAWSYSLPLALLALVLVGLLAITPDAGQGRHFTYIASAGMWLATCTSLLLGRWLGLQVCLRHWPARREASAIVAALTLGTTMSVLLFWLSQVQVLRPTMSPATAVTVGLCALLFIWWGGWRDVIPYLLERRALRDAAHQREIDLLRAERNAAELRLSVLASQIEPHFLFNTLAGVRSAIVSDPPRGVAIIDHLVDYLRSTIPQMRADVGQMHVPLAAELNTVRAYLGVINARMPRLSFTIESEPAWSATPVPPWMLMSLVENAIKHGLEPKPGAGHIAVVLKKIEEQGGASVVLRVSDNGVGFGAADAGNGTGLANIRERLKQLYGDRAVLCLAQNDEGGVDASIMIPIETRHGDRR